MNTSDSRAEHVFATAMEIADGAARCAYVDHTCAGDELLRNDVESLLAAEAQASGFLEGPATELEPVQAVKPPAALAESPGTRIGRYKLLEKIGEGGFGDVWMAEQEEPVRRRVALKIIKLGMDTKEVVARFEAERQALNRPFAGGVRERPRIMGDRQCIH